MAQPLCQGLGEDYVAVWAETIFLTKKSGSKRATRTEFCDVFPAWQAPCALRFLDQKGMNSDCDGHLPPILICDELLLIFPVTCGRNHHQSWVISAFCISFLFSWAVPAPCTLHAPGEALPHQRRGLPWCTPTAPSPTPSSGLVIKCSEHTGLCSPVLQQ